MWCRWLSVILNWPPCFHESPVARRLMQPSCSPLDSQRLLWRTQSSSRRPSRISSTSFWFVVGRNVLGNPLCIFIIINMENSMQCWCENACQACLLAGIKVAILVSVCSLSVIPFQCYCQWLCKDASGFGKGTEQLTAKTKESTVHLQMLVDLVPDACAWKVNGSVNG